MTDSATSSPNLYALLIGIDCYMPNLLPNGSYYKNLGGCVQDINHVEAFLKDTKKIPESQIFKLTASVDPKDPNSLFPVEPPEKLPTRQNMVDYFRELGQEARPGSQVYIHYSGHGGRATTVFPEIKGANELDEGLVPTDIGTSEGQYLRDLELAHLLKELADRGLVVTVVLDCCHSGGATRGEAEVRGNDAIGNKPLQDTFEPVASPQALAETWRYLTGGSTRGLKVAGIPEAKDYVLLAACRQNELAFEFPFDEETKERNGALTYWLLDTLKQPYPGQTYKDLFDRINAKIHSQFPTQTPILLGEGNRKIFATEFGETVFAVPVMNVEPDDKGSPQALLAVGQANGVTKGTKFAIYPRSTTNLTKKADRVAIATIIQRGSTQSLCSLEPIEGKEFKVEPGDQAVQISVPLKLARKVLLFEQTEAAEDELSLSVLPANKLRPEFFQKQKPALEAIRQVLPENGWVELATDGSAVDYMVSINNKGEYEIGDSSGVPIKNITPSVLITDPKAPTTVINRLIHLAKYRAASQIDNTDTDSPLSGKLTVQWLGSSDDYERGDPIPKQDQMEKFIDSSKPVVRKGEHIFLLIRNDSTDPLNIVALNFASDWSIEQILPTRESFITLDPGKEKVLPLAVDLDGQDDKSDNFVKVFATLDQANFRYLELPSLNAEFKSKTRSGIPKNPLEILLAAIDAEQPLTRKLTVATSPSTEWTTKQVLLTITR
jgi:hypothetical protein